MEISRNSLAFKAANLLFPIHRQNMPLCEFFWLTGSVPMLYVVLGVVYIVIAIPVAYLLGFRLDTDEEIKKKALGDAPFSRVRMLETKSGFLVRPIYPLVGAAAMYFLYWALFQKEIPWAMLGISLGATAFVVLCVLFVRSAAWRVVVAYAGASKSKICPTITFTD